MLSSINIKYQEFVNFAFTNFSNTLSIYLLVTMKTDSDFKQSNQSNLVFPVSTPESEIIVKEVRGCIFWFIENH